MSWLKLHNPTIDWPSVPEDLGGVEVIEPPEGIPRETGGTVDSPLESIPVELRKFAEVFSEDMKVTELPLHCPFDLGIDLIDPDKPVKAMVYPLKASDDEELRKLLKEQLERIDLPIQVQIWFPSSLCQH
ncbi:hypothetical protein RhiTH_010963 [Rhizoctonia solani]